MNNHLSFISSAPKSRRAKAQLQTSAARGSHANYATAGSHDHTIPNLNLPHGLIQDHTSEGLLWDPTLNAYIYTYDRFTSTFTPFSPSSSSSRNEESPTAWLDFRGKWGDRQLDDSDGRQRDFLGFRKFVGGPTGPRNKQLYRRLVCPDNGLLCIVRSQLGP